MSSSSRESYFYGSSAGFWKAVQLFAVALTAAALAGCAQSPAVTNKSELLSVGRQVSLEVKRNSSLATNERVAATTKNHTPMAAGKHEA